jgi:two-component system, OmpR family, response regulator QseB
MHLLLVEDDLELGTEVLQSLTLRGFTCVWVRSGIAARQVVNDPQHPFNCAILDLGLKDSDGEDVLTAWRSSQLAIPVIVLTARSSLQSRVALLDAGADDYLVKPIEPDELASRVRAVTRRALGQITSMWVVGDLQLHANRHEVRYKGLPVELTKMEFLVLAELVRENGEVVPKHRLARAVAPLGEGLEANALEVHIHNLRRKLCDDAIVTVRGVGYRVQA